MRPSATENHPVHSSSGTKREKKKRSPFVERLWTIGHPSGSPGRAIPPMHDCRSNALVGLREHASGSWECLHTYGLHYPTCYGHGLVQRFPPPLVTEIRSDTQRSHTNQTLSHSHPVACVLLHFAFADMSPNRRLARDWENWKKLVWGCVAVLGRAEGIATPTLVSARG